jgi:hypothetical protein
MRVIPCRDAPIFGGRLGRWIARPAINGLLIAAVFSGTNSSAGFAYRGNDDLASRLAGGSRLVIGSGPCERNLLCSNDAVY